MIKPATFRIVLLILAATIVGGGIGYSVGKNGSFPQLTPRTPDNQNIVNTDVPKDRDVDFSLFWDVWRRLERDYIDKSKINYEQMVWGAIRGMTASLGDPYTVFLPPEQNKEASDDLNGEFEGIGAQLGMKDERIVVVAPLKGMPAETAGIRAGDLILKVDGAETYGWTVPEAVDKIRGEKGTAVVITILHEGEQETKDISIMRGTIQVPSVETEFRDQVAILKLYQFGTHTNDEWEQQIDTIVGTCGTTCDGLILDLRNNPGGFLQGAVYVSSEFLKDGTVVVQEQANGTRETYTVDRRGRLLSIPMVVLVNKGSASASEIVAGALKARGRARIVGEKTFGKGSVQERQELPGGAGLHITTAKWLLPDDTWINGTGVFPDIEIADDIETADIDEQLERAIAVVKEI
ncbi:S41 family peptidase [Candidatus Roizmanbacteria bacterium]|nr:S41 family peptidase [Candidatus Roizmanbacteria bacterium]